MHDGQQNPRRLRKRARPALIGFLVSFGGVSVFCQNLVFLKKANVKTAVYLLSKITQAVLSFLFLWLYTLL